METLFPLDVRTVYPEGFTYIENFLDAAEEKQLLAYIQSLNLHAFDFHGFQAKRKVMSFGYDYSFDRRELSKGRGIPEFFQPLIQKVARHLSLPESDFAELLVTEYPIGSVINWHRDAFPFEVVAGISLLSDCTFRLRPHDRVKQDRKSTMSFPVKRRSLYIIRGDARHRWQHSIAPVKAVRYSVTLRTLKKGA